MIKTSSNLEAGRKTSPTGLAIMAIWGMISQPFLVSQKGDGVDSERDYPLR